MGKLWNSLLDAGPVIGSIALVWICISVLMHEMDTNKHHCHNAAHNITIEQKESEEYNV